MLPLWNKFRKIFLRRKKVFVKPETHPAPYFPTEREHWDAFQRYKLENPSDHRDYKVFKFRYGTFLTEEHCGDCVCLAATCMRCLAEDLYAYKSTVTWCRCYYFVNEEDKCKSHKGIYVV
jgi:hypothetical protein